MSKATLARPYAQALFELGVEHDQLALWKPYLELLSQVVQDPQVISMIHDPTLEQDQLIDFMQSIAKKVVKNFFTKGFKQLENFANEFLKGLFENKRVDLLPHIAERFFELVEAYEKTMTVELHSAFPVKKARQKAFAELLTRYLSREVQLDVIVDQQLLGGAKLYIRAIDLVIDGSIQGKLNRLTYQLKKG